MKFLMIIISVTFILGISCHGVEISKKNIFLKSLDKQLTKSNKLSFAKGAKIPIGQGNYVFSDELKIVARMHSDNRDLVKDDFLISLLSNKNAHIRYAAFCCLSIRAKKDHNISLEYYPLIDFKHETNTILLEKIKVLMKQEKAK